MKKQTKVLLLAVLALCLLTACKKENAALEVYTLGESEADAVVALDTILEEDEAVLASIDAPTDQAVTEGLEIHHTYHYRKMHDPAALAARYIALLREEEQGFAVIDGENRKILEEPDTDLLWGTVILGKAAAENEEAGRRILRVIVGWSEYAVAVQVAYVNGSILPPIVEKEEEEKTEAAPKPTDIAQQVEYFTSLNPQALGLEGDDMKAYMVFPQQGWVMIDDVSCREISVYRQDAQTATNVLAGTFYLSSDLTHIYKKSDNEQIIPLQVSTAETEIDILELKSALSARELEEVTVAVGMYETYRTNFLKATEYLKNSVRMNIDPNHVPTLNVSFNIDNHYQTIYPVIYEKDTTTDIINAYRSKLINDDILRSICDTLGEEIKPSYVEELISVERTGNSSLSITVIADDRNTCEKIMESLTEAVKQMTPAVKELYGEFDITEYDRSYVEQIDTKLLDEQQAKVADLNNFKNYHNNIANYMSEAQ